MINFRSIGRAASVVMAAVMTLAVLSSASQAQQTYSSPEDVAAALVAAVKTGTRPAILKVLGSDAEEIVDRELVRILPLDLDLDPGTVKRF